METTFEKRVAMMRKIGFRETTFGQIDGMTDGKHSFTLDYINEWSMSDEEFTKYSVLLSETKINEAKDYLESQGYCVGKLWHVNDVEGDMFDGEKMDVLEQALADNTQEIFMSIQSIINN